MTDIRWGYHASHEQHSPAALLAYVERAESAGFDQAMCSDHFAPWSDRQGHSGYAWAWLGAALARTNLSLGCVCAPGQRYHPAIVAQKIVTLGEMFPGRFWVALGSGEAVNEHVTGEPWPEKETRDRRLEESVDVIARMLAGETVTHHGAVTVDRARLWERADPVPRLIGPAVTPQTAARVARWADGLITVNQDLGRLREVVAAYREAGGRGRLALQVHVSWAGTQERAEAAAYEQWATNVFGPPVAWDTATVEAFDSMARHVSLESVKDAVVIAADLDEQVDRITELAAIGFDDVYLHQVAPDQEGFVDAFGEQVLPRLRAHADRLSERAR